ncbi:hypothetical protein HpCOL178_06030 [Helicobacter pylori]
MYNTSQEFLSCFLRMINPFNRDLPHNATMGRDEILQQTPLKLLILQTLKTRLKNVNEKIKNKTPQKSRTNPPTRKPLSF